MTEHTMAYFVYEDNFVLCVFIPRHKIGGKQTTGLSSWLCTQIVPAGVSCKYELQQAGVIDKERFNLPERFSKVDISKLRSRYRTSQSLNKLSWIQMGIITCKK